MTASYDWYFAALANPAQIGKTLPVHESEPQPGFYQKRRGKSGPMDPVAIWVDGDKLLAVIGEGEKPADAHEVWTWCCRSPVTEEAYRKAAAGGGWDSEPPAPAGHNSASTDPFEALTIEYAGEAEQANEFLIAPIATKDDADRAAVWSKRLAAIAKKATDLHKVEKQPALDEGKRVDDKWRDLKDGPKELSTKLKRHLDVYLQEEDRKERERQRIAAEDAARIRREAEDAARAAREAESEDDGAAQAEADRLAKEAQRAEQEAAARNSSAGRTGAKVSLRTFVSARVVDYAKALQALSTHPEMKALVEALANRAVRAGHDLDGVEKVEERRAA